mmetsp:Transcript_45380/g.81629  ORF Transcript_45380/g.81629 Transcript_45380/m.81629 type:complete len:318 (-) Transcript_45380:92-1045(-)
MASPDGIRPQAKNRACVAAPPEVVPEAQPGPLRQHWPELGKPKAAEAAIPGRLNRGAGDASLKAGEAAEAIKAEVEEDNDNEEEEAEDAEAGTESHSRRRRRRRRHRRSSVASQVVADAATTNAPEATSGSEDEASSLCSRNVVTWSDLLGKDHELKPESPSGGFQCATAACWGRLAQQQLQQQRQLPELHQTQLQQLEVRQRHQQENIVPPLGPPLQQHQPAQAQIWEHQPTQEPPQVHLQPSYYDNGSGKVVPLMPASFGNGVQWIVTDAPGADWSPSQAADLRTWLCNSMQYGSVPLSELDLVLQSLSSDAYED